MVPRILVSRVFRSIDAFLTTRSPGDGGRRRWRRTARRPGQKQTFRIWLGRSRLPYPFELLEKAAGLSASAGGDAYAAGEFVAAVADEDPAAAKFVANLGGAPAGPEQDEVCLAFVIGDAEALEAGVEQLAGGEGFGNIAPDERSILHRGRGGRGGERIYTVRRLRFAQKFDIFATAEQTTGAHGGEPVDFGERSADE